MTRHLLIAASGLALALTGCSKPHFPPDRQYGANAPLRQVNGPIVQLDIYRTKSECVMKSK